MGILSGKAIHEEILKYRICVTPFDVNLINPVSLDLRLGPRIALYEAPGMSKQLGGLRDYPLDCRDPESIAIRDEFDIPESGVCLQPGRLYLMHTLERIWTDQYVPIIDGKSSIGRLGIQVHMTAGFGDPGFDGQYTLEVTTVYPVRVYAGMRFCQMRFHTIERGGVGLDLYSGNYTGEASTDPVASKVWRQFK